MCLNIFQTNFIGIVKASQIIVSAPSKINLTKWEEKGVYVTTNNGMNFFFILILGNSSNRKFTYFENNCLIS